MDNMAAFYQGPIHRPTPINFFVKGNKNAEFNL